MIRAAQVRAARKRYLDMTPVLDEQSRRRFVALEAQALGHGGVSLMSEVSGLARSTIYRGLSDIRDKVSAPPGRIPPATRGDPMRPLLWTSRSLRNLVTELAKKGHNASPTVVGDLLRGMGYSLQANSKTREGDQHTLQPADTRRGHLFP
jgi:hypothetical protein